MLATFCVWLCSSINSFSQVTITPTSGCAPVSVSFNAPAGTANWDFGNGFQSNFPNTSYLYSQPGTFVVTYSGVAGNYTQNVVVYANNVNPSFNFLQASSGCKPRGVNFAVNNPVAGLIYNWTFGDGGGASNATSVSYSYALAGSFNATLSALDPASGCMTQIANGPINVSAPANLQIDANPGFASCQAPFTTALTASLSTTGSPLGGSLSYQWNLGNSQTSNLVNTGNITYNQGVFTVSLTATDNNNCVTTKTTTIRVVQPTLSVATSPTICILAQDPTIPKLQYLNIQSSEPNVTINMGEGGPDFVFPAPPLTLLDVSTYTQLVYSTPGIKTRTLTVTSGTCVATVINTVMVEEIVPQFTTSVPNFTCSPVLIKNYTNQSTVNTLSSLSYTWLAQSWDQLNTNAYLTYLTNPTFTFSQNSLNPYTMYKTYAPLVQLTVQSSIGCKTVTAARLDSIRRPTAWFNKDKRQGCAPLPVHFYDSTDTNPNFFPVQSYTWNNGGNPATLVSGIIPPPMVNPTFTYNSPGTYTPYLIVMTAGGCLDTSFVDTVIVVNTPTAGITFTPNLSVCAGQPVTINLNASPASSVISHWHVESDNGYFSGCISNSSPTWPFTHPGVHGFTLTAIDHGCGTTSLSAQTITVNGPVGRSRYRTNCTNKTSVDFFSYLIQAQSATLNFGDGSPSVVLVGNPSGTISYTTTHVYPDSDDYEAILTSVNGGCSFTHTMIVTVRKIKADFDMDTVICNNLPQTADPALSVDEQVGCKRGYTWFVDDLPPIQTNTVPYVTDTIRGVGPHTIRLWVKDQNGCTDEITKTFRVASPAVDFTFNPSPHCIFNNPVQIQNLTAQVPDLVDSYTLYLGQGPVPPAILTNTDFPFANPYNAAVPSSTYMVRLDATDVQGCQGTKRHVLKVNHPQTTLIPTTRKLCVNQPVVFYSAAGYTNIVSFGDVPTFTSTTGVGTYTHTYTTPGIYNVSVTATMDGCNATATTSVSVQSYPTAGFIIQQSSGSPTAPDDSVFCNDGGFRFTSTSTPTTLVSTYDWNVGNGSPILSIPTVSFAYGEPGVYTVTLTAGTENGCTSTVVRHFTLSVPEASLHINKTRFCLGETIQVSLSDSSDIASWKWHFAGGPDQPTITASGAPTPTLSYTFNHFPPPSGVGMLQLYYWSSVLCPGYDEIPIEVVKVEADFNRNNESSQSDFEHCLNLQDVFTNRSTKNNSTFLGGTNSFWSFGNGATSTLQNSPYTYPEPGVYSVSLTITDALAGCSNTAVKDMTIHALPTVTVAVTDSVCRDSPFILTSTGSPEITQYEWMPSAGLAAPTASSTSGVSQESATYSLHVVNRYGCKGSSGNMASVFVQQPPTRHDWDTTVIIGQAIPMTGYQGPGFTYTWSPVSNLSCSVCPAPLSTSSVNITYSIEVMDPMGCFRVTNGYTINIDPLTSVDVPTAFTPNGDGVNDIIYVDGWGIKKLIYFRIFNRWGELLFESFDIHHGWDGYYKGVPQNMETYIYQVSVETYIPGRSMEKTSSFRLIR